MQRHSPLEIKKIKYLRRSGFSIEYIMRELNLPKTTVWHHIHDIKLTGSQKLILRSNQGGSKKRKEENIELAKVRAQKLLNSQRREDVIILAMLYWAEGHKRFTCGFTNTDGKMMSVYLNIMRSSFGISEHMIHVTVRIFIGMRKYDCLRYWSSVTGKPTSEIKLRINDGGTRGKSKYGICRVVILRGHNTLKLIHALVDNIASAY